MASSSSASGSKPPAGRQQPVAVGIGMDDEENKVDFIQRTMMEREASGKRKIKPTYLPETVFMEDSDDPDFDLEDEDSGSDSGGNGSSSSSDSDDDSKSKSSKNSDNEDGRDDSDDDDESNSDSDSSESDESESDSDSEDDDSNAPKNSFLRTMMAKLDKEGPMIPPKRRKKKPKPKPAAPKNELSAEVMASVLSTIRAGSAEKSGSPSSPTSAAASKSVSPDGVPASKPKKQSKPKSAKRPSAADKKGADAAKKKSNKKTANATTETKKKKEKKRKKNRGSLSQMTTEFDGEMQDTRKNTDYTLVRPLCSICLSHKPTYDRNEVVQCDSCRLNCHEECYCLVDDDASETASSSSTAPWFCDACKAGKKEIFCELCPNQDGLFKETENRLWVHKVCAMYTPGAFGGSQKSPADLSGIPNSKWGGKMCSACNDEILARVGVPVKCDAAMCKEHFHVTCAQRLGLLSDPYAMSATNEADPLYISCRAHISSGPRKRQAEMYKIAQEQSRRKRLRIVDFEPRINKKLQEARSNYLAQFNAEDKIGYNKERAGLINVPVELVAQPDSPDTPKAEVVPQKKVRFLENSAFAMLTHQRKVEFSHYDTEAMLLHEKNEKTVQRVSKMWNVNPGITVVFAAYYADRQRRIAELTSKCKKERRINNSFSAKEVKLYSDLEAKVVEQMVLADEAIQIRSEERILRSIIEELKAPPSQGKASRKSKSPIAACKKSLTKVAIEPSSPVRNATRVINGRFATKQQKQKTSDRRLEWHMCSVCSRSEKQHLIIRCDKCRKHYHLGCLDPPLTKKPRITSTCGWMCADCDERDKEEEEEEPIVDVDAPRALRGRTSIKKPVKYTSDHESDFDESMPIKQARMVSPPVKVKKEKESPPPKVKPEKKTSAAPKRDKKAPLPIPLRPVKQEVPNPTKGDGGNPFMLHASGDKMSPVVNMDMNGALSPKPAKSPAKRRSTPNNKQSVDINAIFSSSNPFAFTSAYKCGICERFGTESSLVKCDNCSVNFHFLCLTPPTEYTPKRKGFKWFCTNCDDADDDIPTCLN